MPPDVPQYFVPFAGARSLDTAHSSISPWCSGRFRCGLWILKAAVDTTNELTRLAAIGTGAIPLEWEQSHLAEIALADLERELVDRAKFEPLPGIASQAKQYEVWKSALSGWVYRTQYRSNSFAARVRMPCRDLVNRNAISGCDSSRPGVSNVISKATPCVKVFAQDCSPPRSYPARGADGRAATGGIPKQSVASGDFRRCDDLGAFRDGRRSARPRSARRRPRSVVRAGP